jgi:hypothetical protein
MILDLDMILDLRILGNGAIRGRSFPCTPPPPSPSINPCSVQCFVLVSMLLFCADSVLRTTLRLYMEDHEDHPLPTPEEVLVCYPTTTDEEV